LLWHQLSDTDSNKLLQAVENALRYLVDFGLIELKKSDENCEKPDIDVKTTTLGNAALRGGRFLLCMETSLVLFYA